MIMFKNIRDRIWDLIMSKHPEYCVIPKHLLIIKAFLFPIVFLRYILGINTGYDWKTDVWYIHGIRFTGDALRAIANARGETFRVSAKDGCVTMIKLDDK